MDEVVAGQFDFSPWFPRIETGRLISFRVAFNSHGKVLHDGQVFDDTNKEMV
jgi:hypothetical protein